MEGELHDRSRVSGPVGVEHLQVPRALPGAPGIVGDFHKPGVEPAAAGAQILEERIHFVRHGEQMGDLEGPVVEAVDAVFDRSRSGVQIGQPANLICILAALGVEFLMAGILLVWWERVVQIVGQYYNGRLKGKILTVLGLTYKPGTSTLRRSASLEIIDKLQAKGVQIRAHDPKADLAELSGGVSFEYCRDPYEAVRGSHGILLLTDWPEYRELDYGRMRQEMAHALILDAKNHLNREILKKLGFVYLGFGRGELPKKPAEVNS